MISGTQFLGIWLFPIPPEFIAGFDPELIRDQVCLNLNLQKLEVVHE